MDTKMWKRDSTILSKPTIEQNPTCKVTKLARRQTITNVWHYQPEWISGIAGCLSGDGRAPSPGLRAAAARPFFFANLGRAGARNWIVSGFG